MTTRVYWFERPDGGLVSVMAETWEAAERALAAAVAAGVLGEDLRAALLRTDASG